MKQRLHDAGEIRLDSQKQSVKLSSILQPPIVFSDKEFEHIHNVMQDLQVVKLTVEVLCRRDSNLNSRRCTEVHV